MKYGKCGHSYLHSYFSHPCILSFENQNHAKVFYSWCILSPRGSLAMLLKYCLQAELHLGLQQSIPILYWAAASGLQNAIWWLDSMFMASFPHTVVRNQVSSSYVMFSGNPQTVNQQHHMLFDRGHGWGTADKPAVYVYSWSMCTFLSKDWLYQDEKAQLVPYLELSISFCCYKVDKLTLVKLYPLS